MSSKCQWNHGLEYSGGQLTNLSFDSNITVVSQTSISFHAITPNKDGLIIMCMEENGGSTGKVLGIAKIIVLEASNTSTDFQTITPCEENESDGHCVMAETTTTTFASSSSPIKPEETGTIAHAIGPWTWLSHILTPVALVLALGTCFFFVLRSCQRKRQKQSNGQQNGKENGEIE